MKVLFLIVGIVASFSFAKGQPKLKFPDTILINEINSFNDDDFLPPDFPGGMKQFSLFIAKNIHYPAKADKEHIQGKVILNFSVEKDGTIDKIQIRKSVNQELDEEAVRVLKCSPKWIPGTHHKKPVEYKYSIPMNFQLPKNK